MVLDRLLRAGETKLVKRLGRIADEVDTFEPEVQRLSDAQLRGKTQEFIDRHGRGESLDDLLPEAFAVVREAAVRTIGQRPFKVQLMGGTALHLGNVAEMKTGEGKTLTSVLPAYLNAISGKGVHQVTVNDYLAKRDSENMGRIHRFLGLSVGVILSEMQPAQRREAYAADVTYGTNNEFGFDFLRDNMTWLTVDMVQRGHNFAVVDEADSILIDEARTPLIISGPAEQSARWYTEFARLAPLMTRDVHYEVDERKRTIGVTEEGVAYIEDQLGIDNLYESANTPLVGYLNNSLKVKELFKKDKDYIVRDGEVLIVDEFTGRVLDGRRWSEGLHQAVEAKEGVSIKEENQTLATITLQNYYRLYERLAGMTGTAETEAAEFVSTYGLHVVPVPTHRPLARIDDGDLIYKTEDAKFNACIADIAEKNEAGQPVLVGTISVEKSEKLSRELEKRGIIHEVLNAKQHHREADIVTQAGRLNGVTVATNMAGRGVDILLGGNPEGLASRDVKAEGLEPASDEGKVRYAELLTKHKEITDAEKDEVLELGGLYVLGTERHESRRIDNQLRGRAGRQGDPGASRFYLSLEDELMRLFATGAMSWVMERALPDDMPIEAKMVTKAIERAQNTVEQRNAETRKNVLKYDEVMNEQRKVIYRRRGQILDGADLRDEALEYLDDAVAGAVGTYCVSEIFEEWDLEGLLTDVATLWPTDLTVERLGEARSIEDLEEILADEGVALYEARELELGEEILRQVERQVMLRIIDQKWRQHLREMDLLREGIHLRAMGQKDPATEWQREGFEMFGMMMTGIALDFVKYVMHVQVATKKPDELEQAADEPQLEGVTAQKSEASPGTSVDAIPDAGAPAPVKANQPRSRTPIVKSELEKVGRNDPCPCGSGKKYKQCHGRAGAAE